MSTPVIHIDEMEIPVQLTFTQQTPNYNGHPAIANKSQSPRKMHEEMTEINSCYYRLLLLWKCRLSHFFFLSLWQTLRPKSRLIYIKLHYN